MTLSEASILDLVKELSLRSQGIFLVAKTDQGAVYAIDTDNEVNELARVALALVPAPTTEGLN
jgi:hypothetical protein